jgi:hypothetical protein
MPRTAGISRGGVTSYRHELLLAPEPGKHTLTVVDDEGNTAFVRFTIAD